MQQLKLIWPDGGYRGTLAAWVEGFFGWKLEIVEKPDGQVGFQILPKRWYERYHTETHLLKR